MVVRYYERIHIFGRTILPRQIRIIRLSDGQFIFELTQPPDICMDAAVYFDFH